MNEENYFSMVAECKLGKRLPSAVYLHESLIDTLPGGLKDFVRTISSALKLSGKWNLLKLHSREYKISFLSYPDFDTEAYPALEHSFLVDLNKKSLEQGDYTTQANRPILHRKETMVSLEHPCYEDFCLVTKEGEAAGLYEDSSVIGYSHTWEFLIKQRGYTLVDGRLFRSSSIPDQINRERTAISRFHMSTPMQVLQRTGLLTENFNFLDYGCGRGDDMAILQSMDLDIIGWDPNFLPDGRVEERDIVNLGFVINVIEDRTERDEALLSALSNARGLLVVSAMIASDKHIEKFRPYGDGVITSRNTFQKYYSQESLKEYIEEVTGQRAVPIGQGVFGVFKDSRLEYQFNEKRYRRRREWVRTKRPKKTKQQKVQELIETNLELVQDYWSACLSKGRLLFSTEFDRQDEINQAFPSKRILDSNLLEYFGEQELQIAEERTKDDLVLMYAMSVFSGRIVFKHLSEFQQKEIKLFFGTLTHLKSLAAELLEKLSSAGEIQEKSVWFLQHTKTGYLEEDKSLTIHKERIDELPVLLRAYISCAIQLYGELESIDLVKIHFRSGKVTFLGYDNFDSSPLPMLRERIKVSLWYARVEYFDYVDEFKPKPLFMKSYFLSGEAEDYKKQMSFDEKLKLYGFTPNNPSFGPSREELDTQLLQAGLKINGYRFYKV